LYQNQELKAESSLPLSDLSQNILTRASRVEWLGQMAASVLWMTGMLVSGLSSTGDYLQISAAGAWFVSNIAALMKPESD